MWNVILFTVALLWAAWLHHCLSRMQFAEDMEATRLDNISALMYSFGVLYLILLLLPVIRYYKQFYRPPRMD